MIALFISIINIMKKLQYQRALLHLVVIAAFYFPTAPLHAESLLWNRTEPGWWCGLGNDIWGDGYLYSQGCISLVQQPNISITQTVSVVRVNDVGMETGEQLPCGSTVPSGASIRFKFAPLSATDIYWFGTGGALDSPYGAWGDSSRPPTDVCQPHDYVGSFNFGANVDQYVSLLANSPIRSVAATGSACISGQEQSTCRNVRAGRVNATFSIAPITGKVYHQYYFNGTYGGIGNKCIVSLDQMQLIPNGTAISTAAPAAFAVGPWRPVRPGDYGGEPYTLRVPQQSISCPITVVDATGMPPNPPTITPDPDTTCTPGSAFPLSLTATDPDRDRIRFLLDWDSNGSIDEFVPPSGYISSGSTVRATRTYVAPGAKRLSVMVEDDEGLTSAWRASGFSCAEEDISGGGNDGLNDRQNEAGASDGDVFNGQVADLSFRAVPSLVRSGASTRVHWHAQDMSSCTISSANGDRWNSLTSPLGGVVSAPIFNRTKYTLSCLDANGVSHVKTATVSVAPNWNER